MRSVLFGLAAGLLACGPASAERFTNSVVGLSIEKPPDWCVLSAEANAEDHRKIETANPQLRETIRKDDYVPLFAFTRYAGSRRGLTSTVKVGTRPAGPLEGQSGQQLLQEMLPPLRSLMADLKVVTAPEQVRLASKDAGHMALTYTLNANGGSWRIASEIWAIPRGKYFVVAGATYPPDGEAGDRAAVMKVVRSLELTN